jgi:L-iditol 2-dehydrogenase
LKIARLYNFNDIRIEEIPVPEPGPGDALLKTRASGICSGDVMKWYIEKKAPLVLGHEPSGEIVETGKDVTSFKEGDRVFVHHHAPCFLCRLCRRGDYVQCDTWRKTSIIPGGISEYILVPKINLENDALKLPDKLGYEDGVLIEPLACAVKGLKRARLKRGDTVLVIGLGFMGIVNVVLAKEFGAGKVIGADMVPYRLKKAVSSGADDAINVSEVRLSDALREKTNGEMADIVIVGPNSAEAMAEGISCAGRGATVLLFAPAKPEETLRINPNYLYFRDISIITSYSCGPTDTADALELMEGGLIDASSLITHRFSIEETAKAYEITKEAKDSLKSIIVFE